jgi:Mg-chelatase subunit ChlD
MARRSLTSISCCVVAVAATIGVVACGSSEDSTFDNGSSGSSGSSGASGSSGEIAFGGSSGGVEAGSSGTVGNVKPVSATDACASSNAGVDALPIYLVFMVDRSGSMGGNALATKWTPAVAALKDFFADKASANIHASLTFFQSADICNVATYATPSVAMSTLPSTAFATVLDGTQPTGNTPTRPAVEGAVQYAQSVAAGLKNGEKVAIVLVTDGDPNDNCSPKSTAANTGAAAATVAATIKTYVVGVGNGAANLDTIATGGGTAPHIQVDTTNAATTSAQLRAAIGKIKASQLTCDYTLPAPPNGKTIDVNAVNVNYTTGGKTTTLAYSADCKDANGWHYDNVTTPTKIIMCASICTTLQNDTAGGKVDIIFGCGTAVKPGDPPPAVK